MPTVPFTRLLRRCLFTLICTLLLLAKSAPARAAETADEADIEFQLAEDRYDAGDMKAALQHFLTSNRLAPNKNVLFDIARCYEQLKQLPDAYRYYAAALAVETDANSKQRIQESLTRLKGHVALLTIESDPPGAVIYLDRKDLGSRGATPTSLALPEGSHTVLLELPDFEPAKSAKVDLVLGQDKHVTVKLTPILGVIHVSGTKDANLHLDRETGSNCGVPCRFDTRPGKHVVIASRTGYRTQEYPVEVEANGSVQVRVDLQPLSGTAVVNADVRDALITVDGQPRAFTPAVVSLPVGRHEIVISPSGFRPLRRTVLIENEKSTAVDFELSGQEEVLAASRTAEAVEDAPASVTIISRQELRAMAYPTIAEAIRGVRGIYLSSDDVYQSTGVRGFSRPGDYGNRILVLLDGHPTNDDWIWSSYIGFDARVDIDDIERIEVIRGAGSVVYGTGAFFGVINLVTRSNEEPTHGELAVSSALGAGRARATGVWHPTSDAGIWVSIAGAKSAGLDKYYPEFVSVPNADGTPSITDYQGNPANGTVRDADGFRAATLGGHAWYRALSARWLLTSHEKHLPSAPYGTPFGDPNTVGTDTRGFVDVQLQPTWDNIESLTRVYVDSYHYSNNLPYPSNTVDPTSFGPEHDTYTGIWGGVEQRLIFKLPPAFKFTAGAELIDHFKTHERSVDDRALPGYMGTDSGAFIDNNNPFKNVAGYALLDIVFSPQVRLSAGARLDYFDNLKFNAGDSISPRVALIIKPYSRGNLKLMAGKAFRAPSIYERFYASSTQIAPPEIKPEQVLSAEAEFTHRFSSSVSGVITSYTNYVSHLIELGTTAQSGQDYVQYGNSDAPVMVVGGEAEIRQDFRQGWMLSASTSVQKARYLNDSNLRQVPNSPLVLAAAKAMMPIIGRTLNLATRVSVEGSRYDNQVHNVDVACDPAGANAVPCPAQGTTTPGVVWDLVFSGGLERFDANYSLGLYNVMDWQYDTVPSSEFVQRTIRQRPRTVAAAVSLKF
jgi:outer membrane receptor protein involved in Fe transport